MLKNLCAVSKILKTNYVTKLILVGFIITGLLVTNVNIFNEVRAESGQGNDVFKVIVSLIGITNSTKDIITIVNVQDQTKIKLFNAENNESQDEDKVSYVMTFPGTEVKDGDTYTVCTASVDNFKLECDKGKNSPIDRPEFVDVNVGGD